MLSEKIDGLILDALKHQDQVRLKVLRLIKSEFVRREKDGVVLDDKIEASIFQKMISQREDSIKQFKDANRMDLVQIETNELSVIKEYSPKQATDEDISNKTKEVISEIVKNRNLSMKDTKEIISIVQETYPTANGKLISQIVKEFIK